jgi:hypothetical protein
MLLERHGFERIETGQLVLCADLNSVFKAPIAS